MIVAAPSAPHGGASETPHVDISLAWSWITAHHALPVHHVDRLTVENLVRNEDGTITEIEEATAVMMNWWYVLSIKPGEYEGEAQIKLILERPNNTEVVIQDWSVAFESGKGRGLVLQLALRLEMRGVGS